MNTGFRIYRTNGLRQPIELIGIRDSAIAADDDMAYFYIMDRRLIPYMYMDVRGNVCQFIRANNKDIKCDREFL